MNKNKYVPNIIFFIRLALLFLVIISMICLNDTATGVVYLISILMFIIEMVINKELDKNSNFEKYAVPITDRLLIIVPLLYIAISKSINIWLFLVAITFDIIASMHIYVDKLKTKKHIKSLKTIYDFYILFVVAGIFAYFFNLSYAIYLIYLAVVLCAVFIILKSLFFNEVVLSENLEVNKDIVEKENVKRDEGEGGQLTNEIEDSESRQKEIIE